MVRHLFSLARRAVCVLKLCDKVRRLEQRVDIMEEEKQCNEH